METWLSDISNDICFVKITKRFDSLKATKSIEFLDLDLYP